jgi:glycosyltransferase involved in cell wall biosynthesis
VRILFLAPYVPFPVLHGGRNRTLGLIQCLARFAEVRVMAAGEPAGVEATESRARLAALHVTLDVFAPTGPGPAEADAHDVARPPDACAHFRCPKLREALPRVLEAFQPDAVHFEELVMAQYAGLARVPRVIDRQKVEWDYLEAVAAVGDEAAANRREAARFRRFDAEVAGMFTKAIVIGAEDKRLLSSMYRPETIEVLPIGVDDAIRRPADRTAEVRHVLLYGTVDYAPNVQANDVYFREVWPELSRARPGLRTLVVGSGTPPASLPASDPSVDVCGYVPDIAAVLRGPGVLVVPLRVGGGARTKILEALAAGMPVVSTAIGVENLDLEPGRHYLPAETPSEAVAAVVRLARDPELATTLGREGAAVVESRYRWGVIGRQLESLYSSVVPDASGPAIAASPKRALLVGVRPLPEEAEARGLSFPGHRTAQFRAALRSAGCAVTSVLLDEDPACAAAPEPEGLVHVLSAEAFRAGRELQRLHDVVRPDVVVSAGGYHPARVVAQLTTDRPRFIDLAGDLAAEGQVRAAHTGDGVLADYLAVLRQALLAGDRFAVVGKSQRLLVLGQLGLAGRLTAATVGEEPVDVVPLAARGPASIVPLPARGVRLLWAGGYNTWMDVETLFAGVEKAMARWADIVFVSTGGPIAGHHDESHDAFWKRASASPLAARFEDRGRLPRRQALEVLDGSHVVLSISRPCLEAEVGSRQRVVEALAHGRPAVVTRLGDLAAAIDESGAGLVVPPGDDEALAEALLRLAAEDELLATCAARARRLWEAWFTEDATLAPLKAWVERPRRWPASLLVDDGLARLAEDRLRLQGELDAIRGSRTFRALRLLDRLLGRTGPSS